MSTKCYSVLVWPLFPVIVWIRYTHYRWFLMALSYSQQGIQNTPATSLQHSLSLGMGACRISSRGGQIKRSGGRNWGTKVPQQGSGVQSWWQSLQNRALHGEKSPPETAPPVTGHYPALPPVTVTATPPHTFHPRTRPDPRAARDNQLGLEAWAWDAGAQCSDYG